VSYEEKTRGHAKPETGPWEQKTGRKNHRICHFQEFYDRIDRLKICQTPWTKSHPLKVSFKNTEKPLSFLTAEACCFHVSLLGHGIKQAANNLGFSTRCHVVFIVKLASKEGSIIFWLLAGEWRGGDNCCYEAFPALDLLYFLTAAPSAAGGKRQRVITSL
jgi:hypothetical protein